MEPILWVQPDEVWPDREEPGKVNYILRGTDGFAGSTFGTAPVTRITTPSCTPSLPKSRSATGQDDRCDPLARSAATTT